MNQAWLTKPWQSAVDVLPRTTSDHNPLLLKIDNVATAVPRPFRFQYFWVRRLSFLSVVKDNWDLHSEFVGPYRFAWKLKRLKLALREWNRLSVGNVFENLRHAEAHIQSLE